MYQWWVRGDLKINTGAPAGDPNKRDGFSNVTLKSAMSLIRDEPRMVQRRKKDTLRTVDDVVTRKPKEKGHPAQNKSRRGYASANPQLFHVFP